VLMDVELEEEGRQPSLAKISLAVALAHNHPGLPRIVSPSLEIGAAGSIPGLLIRYHTPVSANGHPTSRDRSIRKACQSKGILEIRRCCGVSSILEYCKAGFCCRWLVTPPIDRC
jgi:hypothetical protein